jgi:hypothetical protein
MGIDGSLTDEDVVTSKLFYLQEGERHEPIAVSVRVGLNVGKDTLWRYYLEGNQFVSGGRTHNYRIKNPQQNEGSSASLVQASSLGSHSDVVRRTKTA